MVSKVLTYSYLFFAFQYRERDVFAKKYGIIEQLYERKSN